MVNTLKNTFKDKRIFITGHTGFKGSWLMLWLEMMGAIVKGYALAPEKKEALYNELQPFLKSESIIDNILHKENIHSQIHSFQPDIIFHLAAQPLVRLSYVQPVETFETNIIGTANILQAVTTLSKPCAIIVITTDKVYENKEWEHAYNETHRLGGYDPYSASKAACEIVCNSYRLSFFNPEVYATHQKALATARAGNVIGGGDYADDRIIPDIVRALTTNKIITVRNPIAVRPWQHVLDPLHGYLCLAHQLLQNPVSHATAYNFGPEADGNIPVLKIVEKAIETWGSGKYETPEQNNQPHEATLLTLEITKAKNELQWKPTWNAETAIEKTMTWYKNFHQNNKSCIELCTNDIEEFMQNASIN